MNDQQEGDAVLIARCLALAADQIPSAKFIGFEDGGHTWVGHDDEVLEAIVKLLLPSARP